MSAQRPMPGESSNYRPGEPLRPWDSTEPETAVDAELIIKQAHAATAVRALLDGTPLTVEVQLTLGRLNSWAVQHWYEPMVSLIDEPRLDPALPDLLRDRIDHLVDTER